MNLRDLKPTIDKCVRLNLPFAVYSFPGETSYRFLCHKPDPDTGENMLTDADIDKTHFEVSLFNFQESYPMGIVECLSPDDVRELPEQPFEPSDRRPLTRSTTPIVYAARVHEIQKTLRRDTEKTVLSRVISGETSGKNVSDIAEDYFSRFPDTFRSLFFMQETGLWIGATPELLFEYDYSTHRFRTMSLAGTRDAASEGDWDIKNCYEQDIVTRYIADIYTANHAENLEISPCTDLRFGDIVHRCNIITGTYHRNPYELLGALSPTPAVAGFPTERAIDTILRYEAHQRLCYGGFLMENDSLKKTLRAYVNLRCAFLYPEGNKITYNIITGGGITRRSDAATEWEETRAKAAPLLNALGN